MYFSKDLLFIKSTRKLRICGVLDGYVVVIPRIIRLIVFVLCGLRYFPCSKTPFQYANFCVEVMTLCQVDCYAAWSTLINSNACASSGIQVVGGFGCPSWFFMA